MTVWMRFKVVLYKFFLFYTQCHEHVYEGHHIWSIEDCIVPLDTLLHPHKHVVCYRKHNTMCDKNFVFSLCYDNYRRVDGWARTKYSKGLRNSENLHSKQDVIPRIKWNTYKKYTNSADGIIAFCWSMSWVCPPPCAKESYGTPLLMLTILWEISKGVSKAIYRPPGT